MALPSFSIFEFSPETVGPEVEQKYKAGELASMRSMLEKQRAETLRSSTDEMVKARAKDNRRLYFIVPITFYASRHLFAKEAWSAEEVREGLMFSTDDLFYGGEDIGVARVSELTLVKTITIPDTQARFVVLTDGSKPEPLIIGVVNSDGKANWLRRYSARPLGAIVSATSHEHGIKKLDGHGYVCWLLASWDFGTETSRIYLDESLNLRFYYLSW